jgi:hypothetical protein
VRPPLAAAVEPLALGLREHDVGARPSRLTPGLD